MRGQNEPLCNLTLLIPGLWGAGSLATRPDAVEGLRAPAWETLLARADRLRSGYSDLETALCSFFNMDPNASHDIPIAALTRLADGGAPDTAWWLRADPVQLRADRDTVVMLGQRGLDITPDEAAQFAAELNALWGADGWHLEALAPLRWYLRLPVDPEIRTEPLPHVIAEKILAHLPQGKRGREWHRVLNEVQMVLHASPVNAAREARGAMTVNSLWFWGAGQIPHSRPQSWSALWSNEPLGKGLARWANIPYSTAPSTAEEWLDNTVEGKHLVVLHGAIEAVQFSEIERWREFVQTIDEEWLAPLMEAIMAGNLKRIELNVGKDLALSVTRKGLRRWWKRSGKLRAWME